MAAKLRCCLLVIVAALTAAVIAFAEDKGAGGATATVTATGCELVVPGYNDQRVVVLPGGGPVGMKVTLRVRETPPSPLPDSKAQTLGKPLEFVVTNPAASAPVKTAPFELHLQLPLLTPIPSGRTVVVAVYDGSNWQAYAPTPVAMSAPTPATIQVTIPCPKPTATVVPTLLPTAPPLPYRYEWFVWDGNTSDWARCEAPTTDWSASIAVLVHGLHGSRNDMSLLAQSLYSAKCYAIYAVEWADGNEVDQGAKRLASDLKAIRRFQGGKDWADAPPHIDVFAHSMGSLMTRAAIELYGANRVVHDLITLGGPHRGIRANIPMYGAPFPQEFQFLPLWPGSQMLAELNSSALPEPERLTRYFTAVGTSYLGHRIPSKFAEYLPDTLVRYIFEGTDGLVPIASAGMDLRGEALSFATASFPVNHRGIREDPAVLSQIAEWLRLPSGVPSPTSDNRFDDDGKAYVPWRWIQRYTPTDKDEKDFEAIFLRPACLTVCYKDFWIAGPAILTSNGGGGWLWTISNGPNREYGPIFSYHGKSSDLQAWEGTVELSSGESSLSLNLRRCGGANAAAAIVRTIPVRGPVAPAKPGR